MNAEKRTSGISAMKRTKGEATSRPLFEPLATTAIVALLEKRLWTIVGGLILLSVFMTPGTARAGAIYFAEALGTLEITVIATVGESDNKPAIEGEAMITATIFDEQGTGAADGEAIADVMASNPSDLGVGDGIRQTAESSGVTTPPSGFAISGIFTEGVVSIRNESMSDVTVSFIFDYSLKAKTSAMDPLVEFAFALAIAEVFTDSSGFSFSDEVASDSDLGGGPFMSSGKIFFDVVVPEGTEDTVTVYVDTFGGAEIPEPATLALFGLGLAGLGWSRSRRKQHSWN